MRVKLFCNQAAFVFTALVMCLLYWNLSRIEFLVVGIYVFCTTRDLAWWTIKKLYAIRKARRGIRLADVKPEDHDFTRSIVA